MNNLRNNVQLIGNIGKELEVKTIANGSTIARFPLATNEYYKNTKGERVKETQWNNIVVWGKTAELMSKMCTKGMEICVQGKLVHRTYDDSEGNRKYVTEIKLNDFVKLGKKEEEAVAPI